MARLALSLAMTPDTGSRSRPDLLAGALAALTAFGAGATFANILFGLPGLTRVRQQAPELGVLLIPTATALAIMAILIVAQRFFIPGYPVTALGSFVSVWALGFVDDLLGGPDMTGVWLVLVAAGGGAALAGLALASAGGFWQRLAIGIGLTAGLALNGKVNQMVTTQDRPPFTLALATCALALVATAVVARRGRSRFEVGPGVGAAVVTAVAGVAVMGALLVRSMVVNDFGQVPVLDYVPDSGAVKYSLLAVAALVTALLAWYAARLGGPGLAYLPVLGFGLAAPMTPVALGFSSVADTAWPVVAGAIVLAAVLGAFAMLSYQLPWEVVGVLAAGGGLLQISTSTGATVHSEYLLTVCGGSFALAAGLVRAAGLRAGAAAAVLGLTTMMLAAQALGPATMDALKLNLLASSSQHAVLPSAISAVVLVVLFALSRAGRGTR